MGRVAITGIHGFIGSALAERFAARGDEVVGVDVVAGGPGVVAGDIARPGPWQDVVAGADLVVHTAASVSGSLAQRERIWQVNALGTANVLAAAARRGDGRMVHLSSVTVFGTRFPDGVGEDHPTRAEGLPYADAKIASELAALQRHAAGDVAVTVVRPGDVYGPGSKPWALLPVRRLRARQWAVPRGGIFSPVHVDDLADGIVAASDAPGAAGRVITLSGGVGVPNERFFGAYADALGMRLPVLPPALLRALTRAGAAGARLVGAEDDANPLTAAYLGRRGTYSIARARELLGWEPRVDLETGLAQTVAWLREAGLVPPRHGHHHATGVAEHADPA